VCGDVMNHVDIYIYVFFLFSEGSLELLACKGSDGSGVWVSFTLRCAICRSGIWWSTVWTLKEYLSIWSETSELNSVFRSREDKEDLSVLFDKVYCFCSKKPIYKYKPRGLQLPTSCQDFRTHTRVRHYV